MEPSSAYTFAPGAMPCSRSVAARRLVPTSAVSSVKGPSSCDRDLVAGVVDDERQVGVRERRGADVARAAGVDETAEALVRADDPRAADAGELLDAIHEGAAAVVVVEHPTRLPDPGDGLSPRQVGVEARVAADLAERVHLPRRGPAVLHPLGHEVDILELGGVDDRVVEQTVARPSSSNSVRVADSSEL